jgi:hypothetical protein
MVRLIDLPAVLIAIGFLILLIWLGRSVGITGATLTQFARSIPSWLGVSLIVLVGTSIICLSIYIWRKLLNKMGLH